MPPNGHLLIDHLISSEKTLIGYKDGAVDWRRYLKREFPAPLRVIHRLHDYPGYRQPSGEHWLHWHDYFEIVVIADGRGVYQCGNHRFDFSAGDIILVDPLKMHGLWDWTMANVSFCLFFHADAVAPPGSIMDRRFLSAFEDRNHEVIPIVRANECPDELYSSLLKLVRVLMNTNGSERRLTAIRFHLLETLFHLGEIFDSGHRTAPSAPEAHTVREERLRDVLEYIARNISQPIPQESVARIAGMSVSRFRSFFKKTTGWKYSHYLLEWRVHHAAKLLGDSTASIAEIAQATGFSDQSHLHRAFKSRHGQSPSEYRKTYFLKPK